VKYACTGIDKACPTKLVKHADRCYLEGTGRLSLHYLQKYLNCCVIQIAISKYEWKLKFLVKITRRVGHCSEAKVRIKSIITH
jgi:hypothetical protein